MGRAGRKIKLFADGADLKEIKKFDEMGVIDGFTSLPPKGSKPVSRIVLLSPMSKAPHRYLSGWKY